MSQTSMNELLAMFQSEEPSFPVIDDIIRGGPSLKEISERGLSSMDNDVHFKNLDWRKICLDARILFLTDSGE